jgi:hypothetical protein
LYVSNKQVMDLHDVSLRRHGWGGGHEWRPGEHAADGAGRRHRGPPQPVGECYRALAPGDELPPSSAHLFTSSVLFLVYFSAIRSPISATGAFIVFFNGLICWCALCAAQVLSQFAEMASGPMSAMVNIPPIFLHSIQHFVLAKLQAARPAHPSFVESISNLVSAHMYYCCCVCYF